MGFPKHLLTDGRGRTLLQVQLRRLSPHYQETLVLTGPQSLPQESGFRNVSDPEEWNGQGPLAGLLAAFKVASAPWVALFGVDQPNFDPELHRWLLGTASSSSQGPQPKILSLSDRRGQPQWLVGLYHREVIKPLQEFLTSGERAIHRFASRVPTLTLRPPDELAPDDTPFLNLNTPEQARAAGWGIPEGVPKECSPR